MIIHISFFILPSVCISIIYIYVYIVFYLYFYLIILFVFSSVFLIALRFFYVSFNEFYDRCSLLHTNKNHSFSQNFTRNHIKKVNTAMTTSMNGSSIWTIESINAITSLNVSMFSSVVLSSFFLNKFFLL